LRPGKVGHLGLDPLEDEAALLFRDLSHWLIQRNRLSRLLDLPGVVVAGREAFFTREALENVWDTTLGSVTAIATRLSAPHAVTDRQ